jgi:type I restriction-modification system DNA methylase subunit
MKITQQQLEAHLWGAANIPRGKTAGQYYKNYILSLIFYKRLCDQWECKADDAIAELEKQQGRPFTAKKKSFMWPSNSSPVRSQPERYRHYGPLQPPGYTNNAAGTK